MEEETTMMIPPQGMDEDMGEGIASLPEQGDSGIADLPQAAQQLAQLGRAQDTFLGHLAQDEIVIPLSLLQASPELEDVIRNAFEAEGMDYTQYVVGSDENSINPETGLPEFGLFDEIKKVGRKVERAVRKPVKKAGRKLEKAVRKPIKKVARELKRAAPVVLPIALTLLAGPNAGIVQQMLLSGGGSGISTLLAGGDLNDALKNAAISAAITGAISGTQKAFAPKELSGSPDLGGGPDLSKVPVDQVSAPTVDRGIDLVNPTDINTAVDNVIKNKAAIPTVNPTINPSVQYPQGTQLTANKLAEQERVKKLAQQIIDKSAPRAVPPPSGPVYGNLTEQIPLPNQPVPTSVPSQISPQTIDFGDRLTAAYDATKEALGTAYDATKSGLGKAKDFIYPTGEGSKRARDELMAKLIEKGRSVDAAKFLANKETGYSALRQFGPTTGLITGGLYASGAFDEKQPKESAEVAAARQKFADDLAYAQTIPQMGDPAAIDYITGQQTLAGAPNYSYLNPLYQGGYFLNNPTLNTGITMAKGGGEMAVTNLDVSKFPRRTGRISGPGTETSDSIPAMLSDGEFVMNARAVRGAGNGSRDAGVRKMYDMMRNFESKVA